MENSQVIKLYNDTIDEIYKIEKLECLRGIENPYLINGKEILVWHNDVTRKCKIKYRTDFDYIQNIDDLIYCSDEILFFTGQLYLYRPFINNPINDSFSFAGGILYPNYQNLEAKRYCMFADTTFEKIYNFWDRIGDLIASFFPEKINPKDVFFTRAIDIIPNEFKSLDSYVWLNNFKDNEYKDLNFKRKEIVHYISTDTTSRFKHLKSATSRGEIEEWINDRFLIADKCKKHIDLTIKGFENTMILLEEIGKVLFEDIE